MMPEGHPHPSPGQRPGYRSGGGRRDETTDSYDDRVDVSCIANIAPSPQLKAIGTCQML